jgi:hypothetical protein
MNEETFSKENFEKLMAICNQIISVASENVDGALMATQMIALGERIKEFIENPIVADSGILPCGPAFC